MPTGGFAITDHDRTRLSRGPRRSHSKDLRRPATLSHPQETDRHETVSSKNRWRPPVQRSRTARHRSDARHVRVHAIARLHNHHLTEYFGEPLAGDCGHCGWCLGKGKGAPPTVPRRRAISTPFPPPSGPNPKPPPSPNPASTGPLPLRPQLPRRQSAEAFQASELRSTRRRALQRCDAKTADVERPTKATFSRDAQRLRPSVAFRSAKVA